MALLIWSKLWRCINYLIYLSMRLFVFKLWKTKYSCMQDLVTFGLCWTCENELGSRKQSVFGNHLCLAGFCDGCPFRWLVIQLVLDNVQQDVPSHDNSVDKNRLDVDVSRCDEVDFQAWLRRHSDLPISGQAWSCRLWRALVRNSADEFWWNDAWVRHSVSQCADWKITKIPNAVRDERKSC